MGFAKGTPKPAGSGRKKGSGLGPIPKVLDRRSIADTLSRLACDPIEGMVKIAQDVNNQASLRGRMFAELAQYVYPKLRSVELSGPGGGPIDVSVSPAELLARRIDSIAARIGPGGSAEGSERPGS